MQMDGPTPHRREGPFRAIAVVFLVAGAAALASCAVPGASTGRPQALDPVTGTGTLAMVAVRATAVSAVTHPITTVRSGFAFVYHRPRASLNGIRPLPARLRRPLEVASGTPAFDALLDKRGLPARESGRLRWLVDGDGFFPELERNIAAAKHSIDIQIFIFDNDDTAVDIANRLKARSAEIPVRVLFDDLGSTAAHTAAPETPAPPGFNPPADIAGHLRAGSSIQVRRTLNPWLTGDHTKLLIFDQRTAILGGMNIGREYRSEWHDLMVRVDGPVVHTLARQFERTWHRAGPWGDWALSHRSRKELQPAAASSRDIPLRVLTTDPARGRYDILEAKLLAIRGARERIWIQNPYFAHSKIVGAVQAAAERGVDVRVIIPARADSTIMDAANLAVAADLIRAGARVFQYPGMTHMKVMLCDGWATCGSANLDTLSLRINRELNLAFSDPAAIRELEQKVFLPDFAISRPLKHEQADRPGNRIIRMIADQL
jgi:cardiolipin synthase